MKYTEKPYTEYMSELVNRTMKEVGSFYCREDIERKRQEVIKQQRKKLSGFPFRKSELIQMCKAYQIDPEVLCNPAKEKEAAELLARVPNRQELCKNLLWKFHSLYRQFPTSAQLFERLVRRQLNGEFAEDSVRLAIVKKFVKETRYQSGKLTEWIREGFSEKEESAYLEMSPKEQRAFIAEHISEEMCERFLMDTDRLSTSELTYFMLEQLEKEEMWYAGMREYRERLLAMKEQWKSLPEEEIKQEQSAFISEVQNVLKDVTYTTTRGNKSDRKTAFRQAKKDYLKRLQSVAPLFRFADQLANGKFVVGGKTKEMLYIFAIVFGLKVYLSEKAEDYSEENDLEKNLFYDYYNDNLLRYVMDPDYTEHPQQYECEPTGEGINYKNYAEVIYLYYIYREDLGLSADEKLCRAEEQITRCHDAVKRSRNPISEVPKEQTEWYKNNFVDTVLSLDEEELVEYLVENYYVGTEDSRRVRTSYAKVQNTATSYDEELAGWIAKEFHEMSWDGRTVQFEYGIDVDNLYQMLNSNFSGDQSFYQEVLQDADFRCLMDVLERRLSSKERNLFREKGEKREITRTRLIALYYCYFINLLSTELDGENMDLPTLLDEFTGGNGDERKGIDYYLDLCRYQKISKKNIFDMFVIFALYLEQIR